MTVTDMGMVLVSRRRVSRIAAYIALAVGGIAAMVWPAPSVANATGWLVYVWAAWLAGGGAACALGAITGRWLGEAFGLPLLAAAFGVYGLVVSLTVADRLTSAAGAAVLWGFAGMLFARWQDVSAVRREALRTATRR